MFRESYVNKYMLLRRLLFPIEFNGIVVSLGCWMVKGGTVLPAVASVSPGTQKNAKPPKSFQTSDISTRFLMISSEAGTRQKGILLEKKAILLLPGDVYMLTLRMDALAVQFIQSHTAFKKIQNFFFFSPRSVLKLLSLLPFLLLVFIALFSSPICS